MTWQSSLRRIVMNGDGDKVSPFHWAQTYCVALDELEEALAAARAERADIEALKRREEAGGD